MHSSKYLIDINNVDIDDMLVSHKYSNGKKL